MTRLEADRIRNAAYRRSRGQPVKRFWTPEEDRFARAMRDRGCTYGQIARRMDRSYAAIRCRLRDYLGGSAKPEGLTDYNGRPLHAEMIAA